MNTYGLQVDRDPQAIRQCAMDEFLLCSFIRCNQGNTCGSLRIDAVASDGQLALIQCDTEVMNRISGKTLGNGCDDNTLVTFSQHAGLSDGFALL